MRIRLFRRAAIVIAAGITAIGLTLAMARADTSEYWCQNGELFVTWTGDNGDSMTISLGRGEFHDGNWTISCNGDRVHSVLQIQ